MFLWRENSGGFHAEAVVLNRPIGFGFKSIDEQEFHRKRAVSPLGVILKYLEEWGERDDEITCSSSGKEKLVFTIGVTSAKT